MEDYMEPMLGTLSNYLTSPINADSKDDFPEPTRPATPVRLPFLNLKSMLKSVGNSVKSSFVLDDLSISFLRISQLNPALDTTMSSFEFSSV